MSEWTPESWREKVAAQVGSYTIRDNQLICIHRMLHIPIYPIWIGQFNNLQVVVKTSVKVALVCYPR